MEQESRKERLRYYGAGAIGYGLVTLPAIITLYNLLCNSGDTREGIIGAAATGLAALVSGRITPTFFPKREEYEGF